MKMWTGRFRQPLNPEFERWQRSFPFDKKLLAQEIAASGAHARALRQIGVLSGCELQEILDGLHQIVLQAQRSPKFLESEEAEDVHHFVEIELVKKIGETGYKLHSGRSRNEQIATDLRLYVRQHIDALKLKIAELCAVFIGCAEELGTTAMPSFTHLQAAEPVLAAHWLLAYIEMFLRDSERLEDCRMRVNLCPLGSGAVAGSTLPLERKAIAQELEFDAPTRNSIDATSDRDFALEYLHALSHIALHASRWAEEFILFSTPQFGFLSLPESYATGSSAMPQKKNPDALELIRGKASRVMGAATSLTTTIKGLPLAYNKDLQEAQEPIFDATETISVMLEVIAGFMKDVAFDRQHMRQSAESGYMNAMAAATFLVNKGVPFRKAHEQIGHLVRLAIDKGCELQGLTLDEVQQFAAKADAEFFRALATESVLACHDVLGGTAPKQVKAALKSAKDRIAALRGKVHAYA